MTLENWTIWIPTLALVIARAAGMVMIAPVFGDTVVPAKLRYAIAVGIALAAVAPAGCLAGPLAVPASLPGMVFALVGEAAIGAMLGGAALLVFAGVELGAMQIASQHGLSMAERYDPSHIAGGLLRRLFVLTAIVVFLAIGGHRALLAGLMDTFRTVPPLSIGTNAAGGLLAPVGGLLAASFMLALQLAAPVLLAMVLATVAMGVLQRTAPQFQIFSTGLPVRALLGIVLLTVALAAMPDVLAAGWSRMQRSLGDLIGVFGSVSLR
jgi:flagellar biosynthetic protein FliR